MKRIKSPILLMLAAVLLLPATFLWNMGRPLASPDFRGLSYFQYLEWHRLATEDSIRQYTASHPGFVYSGIGSPLAACHTSQTVITSVVGSLQAVAYAAASLAGVEGDADHPLPEDVKIWNLPQKSWETFEFLLWYNEIELGAYESPVPYCRLPGNIPTPQELIEMREQRSNDTLTDEAS